MHKYEQPQNNFELGISAIMDDMVKEPVKGILESLQESYDQLKAAYPKLAETVAAPAFYQIGEGLFFAKEYKA